MAKKPSSSARGLDYRHRQRREWLLSNHVDGSACDECGRGLFRLAAMNFDGAALEADHELPRATHGNSALPNRVLHKACNAKLGGQLRARRPANGCVTTVSPSSRSILA